jgi:site-specific DNA recombinase
VYALTRFSRNSADHHAIAALLRGSGVMLRSATEPIDESPSGKLMEAILAGVAQFDNDVRADRTLAGIKAAAARGRWVWLAPIGYRNTAGARDAESRAGSRSGAADPPRVRRCWRAASSWVRRCARLRSSGCAAAHGRPLAGSRLHALLRNPVYTGRIEDQEVGQFDPRRLRAARDRGDLSARPSGSSMRIGDRRRSCIAIIRTFRCDGSCAARSVTAG